MFIRFERVWFVVCLFFLIPSTKLFIQTLKLQEYLAQQYLSITGYWQNFRFGLNKRGITLKAASEEDVLKLQAFCWMCCVETFFILLCKVA